MSVKYSLRQKIFYFKNSRKFISCFFNIQYHKIFLFPNKFFSSFIDKIRYLIYFFLNNVHTQNIIQSETQQHRPVNAFVPIVLCLLSLHPTTTTSEVYGERVSAKHTSTNSPLFSAPNFRHVHIHVISTCCCYIAFMRPFCDIYKKKK